MRDKKKQNLKDKSRNLTLCPTHSMRTVLPLPPELRLLNAIGAFEEGRCKTYWNTVQSCMLTEACVDEANAVYHQLLKGVLRSNRAMRRFCAANPDAVVDGCWCPTYDFVHVGSVNDYRLRCMLNNGDFNFFFYVYQKNTKSRNNTMKEAA